VSPLNRDASVVNPGIFISLTSLVDLTIVGPRSTSGANDAVPVVRRMLRGPGPPTFTQRSKQEATDCERGKPGKETAYEIASPIRPASQVLAHIRIHLKTKLRRHSSGAF